MSNTDETAAVASFVASFGAASRRLVAVVSLLAGQSIGLDELIRRSGLSRLTIEGLLAAAGPDLETHGNRYALRPDRRSAYEAYQRQFEPPHPPSDFDAQLADLTRRRPPGSAHLDHVAATPATLARRAAWLAQTYDLRTTRLVFLGDHDLTSLATCLLHPRVEAQVVDIDENLLAYLEVEARRLGAPLRCSYGDLRFGLPRDVAAWGDVIFTDPPYSPEGVALFARRGLDALRDREFGQVVVAYGYGERHATLGWKAQRSLSDLGLAFQAVLPDFSTYIGAQAIGSTSDLYVCRPTARSWKLPRQSGSAHIYTRGRQAREAGRPAPSQAVRDAAVEGADLVVSESWTGPGGMRHVHLGTLFESGMPTAWAKRVRTAVIDLSDDPGPWLLRSLLAINAARVAIILPERHRLPLLTDKYTFGAPRKVDPDSPFVIVDATAVAPGSLSTHVLRRAHGNLRNVVREGLIEAGRASTKNEARAIVDDLIREEWPSRLIDLSRHQLDELLASLGASTEQPQQSE